jgi:hypothetical protein
MIGNLAHDNLFEAPADNAPAVVTALPATADRDVFGLLSDPVAAGLGLLAHHPPLWGDASSWAELLSALRSFHDRWTTPARAAGWSDVQLFGLDPVAPRARLSRMGGAFLACLPGRQVLGVDTQRIALVTRTSAPLSVYCPEAGGVLAWELCSSAGP